MPLVQYRYKTGSALNLFPEDESISPTLQKSVDDTRAVIKRAFEQRKRPVWMRAGKAIGDAIRRREKF